MKCDLCHKELNEKNRDGRCWKYWPCFGGWPNGKHIITHAYGG